MCPSSWKLYVDDFPLFGSSVAHLEPELELFKVWEKLVRQIIITIIAVDTVDIIKFLCMQLIPAFADIFMLNLYQIILQQQFRPIYVSLFMCYAFLMSVHIRISTQL